MTPNELFALMKDHVTVEVSVDSNENGDDLVVEVCGYDSPEQWHDERNVLSTHRLPLYELAEALKGY